MVRRGPPSIPLEPLSPAESQALEAHLDLIDGVVTRLSYKLPPFVELDDLKSAGTTGLIKAMRRFDPAKNVKFATYARLRIHGEILDYLRAIDPVPRSIRRRCAMYGEAPPKTIMLSEITNPRGRIDEDQFYDAAARQEVRHDGEELWSLIESELGASLGWFVRERYQHERKLKDIAADVGLTESRMCQIDKVLRNRLAERGIMDRAGWTDTPQSESLRGSASEAGQHPADFRLPAEVEADAQLTGVWHRCPQHGLIKEPMILGSFRYCSEGTCPEKVILAHSDLKTTNYVIEDGHLKERYDKRRKETAVSADKTAGGRPRAIEVMVEILRRHEEPVRAHVLTDACEAAGHVRGGIGNSIAAAVGKGYIERVGVGLYRLGPTPVPPASARWDHARGPRKGGLLARAPKGKPEAPMPYEADTATHDAPEPWLAPDAPDLHKDPVTLPPAAQPLRRALEAATVSKKPEQAWSMMTLRLSYGGQVLEVIGPVDTVQEMQRVWLRLVRGT